MHWSTLALLLSTTPAAPHAAPPLTEVLAEASASQTPVLLDIYTSFRATLYLQAKAGSTFTSGSLNKTYTMAQGDGELSVVLGPPTVFDKSNIDQFNF